MKSTIFRFLKNTNIYRSDMIAARLHPIAEGGMLARKHEHNMGLFLKKRKSNPTVTTSFNCTTTPSTATTVEYPASPRPVVFHGPRGISENTLLQKTAELEAALARHDTEKKKCTFHFPEVQPERAEEIVGELERQRNEDHERTEWAKIKQADLSDMDGKISSMYHQYQYLAQEDYVPACTMTDISGDEIEQQTHNFPFDAIAAPPASPGDIPELTDFQKQERDRVLAQGLVPKGLETANEIPELTEEMLEKLKGTSESDIPT